MSAKRQRNYELERLIRVLVHTVGATIDKNIGDLEQDIAEQLATDSETPSPRTVQNYYVSKGKYTAQVIEVFLRCAASCPYLNRAWGEKLLRLTGFDRSDHFIDLLQQLWPSIPVEIRIAQARKGFLPPPTYSSFVMRSVAFPIVMEALSARNTLVLIEGMGGIGKTSLAREVAWRCVNATAAEQAAGVPPFDLTIWVSDKDQPGKTWLSTVLDLVADVLGAPELTRLDPDKKQVAVENLLRGRRTLLIVDNLETVSDPALLYWLPRVPEPSKVLITSRESRPELIARGAWRVELKQLTEAEGREFIIQHSRRIGFQPAPDASTQLLLIERLGGNPKAIEIILGLAQRSRRPVAQLLQQSGSELASLVASSWATLKPTERKIGMALALFPASVGDAVLAQVAGIDIDLYYKAVQQLQDLALIETEQYPDGVEVDDVRRSLHPVPRQFITAQLQKEGLFAAEVQARRAAWAVEYAETYGGFRPNEPQALARLALEEPNLWAIFQWASDHGPDRDALTLATRLEYFYYTRALWGKNRDLYQRAIRAARRLGDPAALCDTLALLILLLSRQGQPAVAQNELAELVALSRSTELGGEHFFRAYHAPAVAYLALSQLEAAATSWQMIIDQAEERGVSPKLITGTLHWLALCRQRQGEPSAARALMEQSLALALEQKNPRRAARNQIALASFALDAGNADEAARYLDEARANDPVPDQEQRAHYLLALGRLQGLRGETDAARAALAEALPLFERMGMEPEVREVRARQDALDT